MTTPILSGSKLLVSTTTPGLQYETKVSQLSGGRCIVTWTDTGGDTSSYAVRGQIIRADGSKEGPEFVVNTQTLNLQLDSDVTTLANGNFVVTWVDQSPTGDGNNTSVKAQIFSSTGAKIGTEFLVNQFTLGAQDLPAITALSDGGFAVTFRTAIDTIGFFADTTFEANTRIFNANGTARTGEFTVNQLPLSMQEQPEITTLANGNILVVWEQAQFSTETLRDESGWGLSGRIFTPNGTAVTNDFPINTITDDQQQFINVASLTGGGFVATWMDRSGSPDDPSLDAVRAQVFNSTGAKVGAEFLVNTTTLSTQNSPVVIGLSDGRFLTAWTDESVGSSSDIRAQLYNANGTRSGVEFLVNLTGNANQGFPAIAELSDGRVMITWRDADGSASGDIAGQIIDPRDASVNFVGTSASDIYVGTRFGDTISGLAGADKLMGEGGNDTLNGGDGNDTLRGGAGGDAHNGGDGTDYASYYFDAAVTVALDGSLTRTGTAVGDTFNAIENLSGSNTGNDILAGNASANQINGNGGEDTLMGRDGDDELNGGEGNDNLRGGAGSDEHNGGEGIDFASYYFDAAVTVALDGSLTRTGAAVGDTFISIENLSGSNTGNDTLAGNAGANQINGNAGSDTLMGLDGDDIIKGGLGNDTMTGGVGADQFHFDTALNAATNKDTITGLSSIDKIVLDNDIFTALGASFTTDEFRAIDSGSSFASVDTSDNIIYVKSTGQLFYDQDGSGSAFSRILFAELPNNTVVSFEHFLLIE